MAVQEQGSKKGAAPETPGAPAGNWLERLNDYGERHATAIIAISTGLIILTVLIFAKYFYDKAQVERAEQELSQASGVDQLKELKTKYGATPVASRIVFRLANKYYEEGKLDIAHNEYKEFQARFPNDPLQNMVTRAINSLERNKKFESDLKEARLKEHRLLSHPRQMPDVKDPRFEWGPLPARRTTAELQLPAGTLKVDLFEDEAPNAVAAFVKLAEQKYFDGAKWEIVGADERIQTQAKAEGAQDLPLAIEDSKKPPEALSLVLVKKDAANQGAQFQILLKSLPDLRDVTVFGAVTEGMPFVKAVKKDDTIVSVKITSKRDHVYEPKLNKP